MDVVVIGGSAAGLKAACRINRLQPDASVKVIVREKTFGYSACGMAYYVAGDIDHHTALIRTPNGTLKNEKYYRDVKNVYVLTGHEVESIDRVTRMVYCRNIADGQEKSIPYDKLVIATGSQPINPAIPGINTPGITHFARLENAIAIRQDLEKGLIDSVAVLGGGTIGLELCEAFRAVWGVKVDLIELQPQVLSGLIDLDLARLVEEELVQRGVNLRLGCRCTEIVGEEGKVCLFDLAGEMIPTDRVVVAAGVKPDVSLAKAAGLEIGATGGIKVSEHLVTSDPDIFAAGDCVELISAIDGRATVWSLGSLASRMGRIVGDNICDGSSKFGPVTGATVLKLFDITIGSVGLTAAECRGKGYNIGESWGTFHDRLHYYPEAVPLHVKLVYDKASREVLGVQGVSHGQLLHIINVASQLIHQKATVDAVAEIEHAYAPPFAQPFDPLHYLVYIADNSGSAGVKLIPPGEFDKLPADTVIIDTRIPDEIANRPLNTGERRKIEIPVEELRARINEVPGDSAIVTVCQMGGRAWDAALMLRRAGWSDVGILAGGALFLPKAASDKVAAAGRRGA